MPASATVEAGRIGRVRWGICALLFFATTINYVDRSVLGILAPTLRTEIGWTDLEYGRISAAFTLAYAIGFIFAGWFRENQGSYVTMFTIAGVSYLVAIAAIHLLAPRLEPAQLRPAS